MGIRRASIFHRSDRGAASPVPGLFAFALMLISTVAGAQDQAAPNQNTPQNEGFIATVSRWFEEQTANVNSTFRDARKKLEGFSSAANDAAKTTVEGARDAADAVASRTPALSADTRNVSLHPTARRIASPRQPRFAGPKASGPERAST
jgi:hypothetical protein